MNALKLGRVALILALTAAFAALSLGVFAQVTPPGRVNYQGVVRDAAGVPLNGSVTMTFKFFDDPTAGTLLWEEIYDPTVYPPQVTVSAGLFTLALGDPTHRNGGSETSFSDVFANHANLYLAVRVAADAEMTPRVQVVSAPFAVSAGKLEGRGASSFANTAHTHAGTDITSVVANATHAVTADSATNATNCTNADTVDGQHAAYFLNTSSASQTKAEKLILNGATDYGIYASGPTAGGYMASSDGTGHLSAGLPNTGMEAYGAALGGSFFNNYGEQVYLAYVEMLGQTGVWAHGTTRGGYFEDRDASDRASVAVGGYGIYANGTTAGGYFEDADNSGYANVGYGDYGIEAHGNAAGGYFKDKNSSGYAYVGVADYGIQGYGSAGGGFFTDPVGGGYGIVGYDDFGVAGWGSGGGGHFDDTNSADWADVSYSTYKIFGTGTVSFVQNHPTEKDKVIVYACPEGDEVATYTRGTAKLVNGEARVELGETFQWVTNSDIGLTAHLTPKDDCKGLYAESVSTTDMIVKELNGGKSNAAFDYLVYGLRIGFEESSIVQEKQRESYIPSFQDHRERYAKYPDLRAFNALERFKTMESSVRGVSPEALDLSRAMALKDAIHEYEPATDPPVDKLFGHGPGPGTDRSTPSSARPAPGVTSPVVSPQHPVQGGPLVERAQGEGGSVAVSEPKPSLPCLPVSDLVEPGDVLVMDSANEKHVVRCAMPADPLVVGIAAGRIEECEKIGLEEVSAQVPVATSGIVPCKVDAGFGPIRRGDLLVASPNTGHAMRAVESVPGTFLGKALEPMASGTGLIKVLVMLR